MQNNQRTTIGLDLGTSNIKGVCWSAARGVIHKVNAPVELAHPGKGRVEINPEGYLRLVAGLIRELADAACAHVDGIAFAAASGNTLLCRPDGTPATPIISWLDTRLDDWMPPTEWHLRRSSGWPAIPTFPPMHLEYFRREMPEKLKASIVAMNNDWLCWRLCGRHALDTSNATPFYLWKQGEDIWNQAMLDYYGIGISQLPEMLPPGRPIAMLAAEFHHGNLDGRTLLATGSFDHPAAARAVNITRPGDMLLSCGTSWVGFYPAAARQDVPETELCDVFQSADGGCWGGMFSLAKVGREIEDFILERYGDGPSRHIQFNQEAMTKGTPARKLMDDVITRFRNLLERSPRNVGRMVVCGGPSEGEAWPGAIEELLRVSVETSPYKSHTGAAGAAMLAASACDMYLKQHK